MMVMGLLPLVEQPLMMVMEHLLEQQILTMVMELLQLEDPLITMDTGLRHLVEQPLTMVMELL